MARLWEKNDGNDQNKVLFNFHLWTMEKNSV